MKVVHSKLKVAADEMRLHVRRSRRDGTPEAHVARGEQFPTEQFEFMLSQLTQQRQSMLSTLPNSNVDLEAPFVTAWADRGYDTTTIRFSIRHLLGARQQWPRVRVPRQRPGVLHVRWAREDHDETGDICTCWHVPCSKRDSNFFHHWLTMALALPGQRASWDITLYEELKRRGFDITSLRFEVHHAGRPAALAKAEASSLAHQPAMAIA